MTSRTALKDNVWKFKENIGLATVSADPDIANGLERLTILEREVSVLRSVLKTVNDTMMVQTPRAKNQMVEALSVITSKFIDGPRSEVYNKFATVNQYLNTTLAEKLTDVFNRVVLGPIDEWLQAIASVRTSVNECVKYRRAYDHYKEKVKDLIGSKQKAQLRGKIIDKTTEERLTRNHEKLAQAEAAFLEARDSAMAQLLYCFEDTVYRLDLILLRVMQYEKQVYQDGLNSVKSYESSISVLLGSIRDRKAAQHVNRMAHYVTFSREERLAGRTIDFMTIAKQSTTHFGVLSSSTSLSLDDESTTQLGALDATSKTVRPVSAPIAANAAPTIHSQSLHSFSSGAAAAPTPVSDAYSAPLPVVAPASISPAAAASAATIAAVPAAAATASHSSSSTSSTASTTAAPPVPSRNPFHPSNLLGSGEGGNGVGGVFNKMKGLFGQKGNKNATVLHDDDDPSDVHIERPPSPSAPAMSAPESASTFAPLPAPVVSAQRPPPQSNVNGWAPFDASPAPAQAAFSAAAFPASNSSPPATTAATFDPWGAESSVSSTAPTAMPSNTNSFGSNTAFGGGNSSSFFPAAPNATHASSYANFNPLPKPGGGTSAGLAPPPRTGQRRQVSSVNLSAPEPGFPASTTSNSNPGMYPSIQPVNEMFSFISSPTNTNNSRPVSQSVPMPAAGMLAPPPPASAPVESNDPFSGLF